MAENVFIHDSADKVPPPTPGAIALELEWARYAQYPNLSTLPLSQAASDSLWRTWLASAPHLLISGPTGSGKTTLARALLVDLADRRNLGLVGLGPTRSTW